MTANEVTQRFVECYYTLYSKRVVATKKQFCDAVGTYSYNLNMMQRGQRQATVENLCRAMTHFNISPRWMFTGMGEFFNNSGSLV